MSEVEKKNILLVINFDNLVVGDKFYFNSGCSMLVLVCKLICDCVLVIVCSKGIVVYINLGFNLVYLKGISCCNDVSVFDNVGILVLLVEVINWLFGKKDGYQQWSKLVSFLQGISWYDVQLDNQQYIDYVLFGCIEYCGCEVVKVMLLLVKELVKVEKKS